MFSVFVLKFNVCAHNLLTMMSIRSCTDLYASHFQEALKNILIIFAKLNPGIRYVQGMNEILAPLFYVFRNDPDEEYAVSTCQFIFFVLFCFLG